MKNCVLNHTSSDNRAKWQRGGIRRVGNAYSIITDGILSRQDYNILFENISGKRFIPKETAESVNIYSDVSFSSDFFRFMDNSGISVNLFDKYGRYNGTFLPSDNKNSGKTLIKQATLYLDEGKRLETARKIELAALHNLRANLKYYGRRKEGRFSEAVDIFDDIFEDMKKADEEMRMMEEQFRIQQEIFMQQINQAQNEEQIRLIQEQMRMDQEQFDREMQLAQQQHQLNMEQAQQQQLQFDLQMQQQMQMEQQMLQQQQQMQQNVFMNNGMF